MLVHVRSGPLNNINRFLCYFNDVLLNVLILINGCQVFFIIGLLTKVVKCSHYISISNFCATSILEQNCKNIDRFQADFLPPQQDDTNSFTAQITHILFCWLQALQKQQCKWHMSAFKLFSCLGCWASLLSALLRVHFLSVFMILGMRQLHFVR